MKRYFSLYILIALLVAAGAADLRAQNVVVDKSQLTLSAPYGGAAATGQVTVTSSTGAAMTFFTFSNNPWIKINDQNSTSGTTPSTITVKADPTGLAPGTYNGSISVFGGANSVTVNVALTVSSIGVSPSSVTFSGYTVGGTTLPGAQAIALSGVATQFTAVANTTNGGAWLQITPATGTSPGTIFAQLNPAIVPGLAVGTYTGQITITPVGGTTNVPVNIPVTLTVSAAPVVTATPSPLQFTVQIGGTNNITTQTLTIATAPAAQITYGFTATVSPNPAGKNWITVNPPSGATDPQSGSAPVTIGVDFTGLPAGTYTGQLTLITPGASPAQTNIPVSLTVSSLPLLNVPSTPLSFTYQLGTAVPAAQNVNITATSGTLNYTAAASAAAPWLTVPASGSTAAPLAVSVNPAGLAPGTYTGTITVTSAGAGNSPQTVNVTLKVTNDPVIVTSLASAAFAYQIGQAVPASQLLKITSSTGAPLTFTATPVLTGCTSTSWLALNGNAGATVSGSTDASLVVSVNPTGLAAGTCQGKITIAATVTSTGAAAVNSPLDVPITLYVSTTPLLVVSPSAPPTFTVGVGAQSAPPQTITLTSTSAAAADQLNYSVTFQTNNGGSWLFVGPLSGTTVSPNNTITISVIPSLLSAGTYSGTVTITATGTAAVANSPVSIPVTLTVAPGSLTLSSTSLSFSSTLGGAKPATQTVTVGSSGTSLNYTAVSSAAWLSVTPANGNTASSGTLTVGVDPTNLAAGTYNGTITVTAPGAGNSPATINVAFIVQPGTISAPTTTLTFNQLAGGAAPAAQTIAVTGTPGPLNFTVATSANTSWLSVTPASGTTPGSVQVKVNAGSMAVGQYTGSVIITSAGAAGSPITVPVVFNVTASQTLTANPASLTFNYVVGQTVPASQNVAVTISGGSASIAAQVSSAASAWLAVSPASGTTPANLTIAVTPGTLSAGTYNGTVSVTSPSSLTPLNINVTLTVVAIPKPVITAIDNAASYSTGGISPGENITIFGTGVGPGTLAQGTVSNAAWTTTAGNTRVLFDGVPAPVIYASATQTSVMVPYGTSGRTTTSIVVEYSGVRSDAVSYNVVAAAPGIYTLNQQGTGPGAVLNQDGVTVNSPASPEKRGNVVAVYMTGEGQTLPAGVDGTIIPAVVSALKKPILPVTATVGGVAANVLYYGSAPGLVSGVMQVNVQIPAGVATGSSIPIQITVGTAPTQPGVTIAVSQ
ncbi:MAG: hypothetical protein JST11_08385 [Acidobacteria bacterium]|nr:hypothetical protein [Acidobacteriota bacterium]